MNIKEYDVELTDFIKEVTVNLSPAAGAGVTTSDDTLRAEILKSLIYKKADFLSVGTKLVGIKAFKNLDVKISFPSEAAIEYPVPEGAGADLTRVEWSEFGFSLAKAEGRFMITDEARVRGVQDIQWSTSIRRLSEALAAAKDANILTTLQNNSTHPAGAATAAWTGATAANILADIATWAGLLFNAQGVQVPDFAKLVIVVPVDAYVGLWRLQTIGVSQISLLQYLQSSYQCTIVPTKLWTTTGVAVIAGEGTAIHGTLDPPANVPLVENLRHMGIGTEYCVRSFFATRVINDTEDVDTSDRIVSLTGLV